jgi:tetratricopeptide (TPR) repeat protein
MPERAAELRNDLAELKLDVDDFGFNGSPLYTLIRRIDPSLYRLFGPRVCLVNLAWQWAALFLMAFLAGRILQWTREDTLLFVALVLASWDYTGWALNGLIAAGWMLPAMLALWGFHRRNPALAGFGIAWAGLIKLFPFVLILPPAVLVARQVLSRHTTPASKEALKTLAACAVFTAALAAISSLTGLSWTEFFQKILIQFQDSSYLNNSAGISSVLLALGLKKSLSIMLPQATVFFALLWILWMRREEDLRARLPSVSLLLLASMPWLTQTWLNYYAIVGLFLLPGLLRTDRRTGILLLALFALSAFLPEYGFAYGYLFAFMPIVKVLGYLILPLVAIAMEIRDIKQAPNSSRCDDTLSQWLFDRGHLVLFAGAALSVLSLCAEIYIVNTAGSNLVAGRDLYRKGLVSESRQFFEQAVKHAPRNAAARIELAQAMADMQDVEGALAQYRKAVELNPSFAPARSRLGVLLVRMGKKEEALAQFQEAARLTPYDETIQLNCGSALLSIGRKNEAAEHFRTALDANPDFEPARKQWERAAKSGSASTELQPLSKGTIDLPR